MRILILNWQDIKNPFAGGAEVHMHKIFSRLAAKSHDITLFCCEFPGCKKNETIDGIKIIRKGSRNLFNYVLMKEYISNFSKENYDLIIDDINKIPFYTPLYVKKPLLAISHHFFGKSIFKETGIIGALYVYLAEKLISPVYKKTKFTVVSQSTLDEFIEKGFDKNNFVIIPNAIDTEKFDFTVREKDKIIITYFGRLKKYKSVDQILRAFKIILNKYPEAGLNIAGDGDQKEYLQNLAEELGISEKVKFWGYITDEQKKELLSESFCVINPSMKEGWGITNIEANACGTPVISANVPGLRDSVLEGKSGLLYEYGNIDMMAKAVFRIIEDKNFRLQISNTSVDWAKKFSWDESALQMEELCYKILNNKW